EVLIKVLAAGINRPDVLQRKGHYPVPAGASDIPGLEVAGEIVGGDLAHADNLFGLKVGDKVCALVQGGGYAELCTAPIAQCLPYPKGFTDQEAASLPETFYTVWSNVFMRGELSEGETLLVQGGSSGIGVTAILIAKALGHKVFVTAGTDEKCAACVALGMGGSKAEVNTGQILRRRLTITGSTLRPRPVSFKKQITQQLHARIWPLLDAGKLKPVIYKTFALDQAADAHRLMESSEHVGKIVLTV
ncbi:MAG: NAD(P)H-quinone oxidoreductase, partial [Polynucleobacter sp. 35-46-207]